ncbi:Uncharacterized protein ToN1_33930 [Aromatoleum petrolei]|nr:Uncharacterized protein ToN1_33930 [Aromatoleum petrolei]
MTAAIPGSQLLRATLADATPPESSVMRDRHGTQAGRKDE